MLNKSWETPLSNGPKTQCSNFDHVLGLVRTDHILIASNLSKVVICLYQFFSFYLANKVLHLFVNIEYSITLIIYCVNVFHKHYQDTLP